MNDPKVGYYHGTLRAGVSACMHVSWGVYSLFEELLCSCVLHFCFFNLIYYATSSVIFPFHLHATSYFFFYTWGSAVFLQSINFYMFCAHTRKHTLTHILMIQPCPCLHMFSPLRRLVHSPHYLRFKSDTVYAYSVFIYVFFNCHVCDDKPLFWTLWRVCSSTWVFTLHADMSITTHCLLLHNCV